MKDHITFEVTEQQRVSLLAFEILEGRQRMQLPFVASLISDYAFLFAAEAHYLFTLV